MRCCGCRGINPTAVPQRKNSPSRNVEIVAGVMTGIFVGFCRFRLRGSQSTTPSSARSNKNLVNQHKARRAGREAIDPRRSSLTRKPETPRTSRHNGRTARRGVSHSDVKQSVPPPFPNSVCLCLGKLPSTRDCARVNIHAAQMAKSGFTLPLALVPKPKTVAGLFL